MNNLSSQFSRVFRFVSFGINNLQYSDSAWFGLFWELLPRSKFNVIVTLLFDLLVRYIFFREIFVSILCFRYHPLRPWSSETLHFGKHSSYSFTFKQNLASEALSNYAPEAPNINFLIVGESQNNLWSSVTSGLKVET